jgi:hypothetical protein
MRILLAIVMVMLTTVAGGGQTRPRGRDLGIPFPGMLGAETMTGADGIRAYGLPGNRVVAALRKYNRMK